MSESVLVTGGAGFIGAHVAWELKKNGYEVVALDDLSGGFADNVPEGVQLVTGSILDEALVEALFQKHHFSYVFHIAAYAAEVLSPFIKRFNYRNNLIGSINLINASVNYDVKCFVFTSSIAVYGHTPPPMMEDQIPMPQDSYGIAKYAVELELRSTHDLFGLDYVIFRPHNVYGELQNIGDRYRNAVGIFMNQVMSEKPMTVFGDGEQMRAFSYIGDVAPIIAKSIEVPEATNEIFNVGADTPYTVNELARMVAKALGDEPSITYLPARSEVTHAFSDHKKVRRVFGNFETVDLEEGVSRMAKWARKAGARKSNVFEEIEIARNLPESWALAKNG